MEEWRVEVEKGGDDLPAIVQRCRSDEPSLKLHIGLTEQPPLTLQGADERRHIAIVGRAADLLHDKRLPRSGRCRRVRDSRVDKVPDEGAAAHASIDVRAQPGIERDGSLKQK